MLLATCFWSSFPQQATELNIDDDDATSASAASDTNVWAQLLGSSLYRWKVNEAEATMQVDEQPTAQLLHDKVCVAIYFRYARCFFLSFSHSLVTHTRVWGIILQCVVVWAVQKVHARAGGIIQQVEQEGEEV